MSETAPERPASGGGNVLTHKLGPLPTWLWIALAALIIVAWAYWRNRQASNASAANTSATGTSANDVPQFVNQTYTTVTPPSVNVTAPTSVTAGTPPPANTGGGYTVNPKPPIARPGPSQQPPIFNATYTVLKGETLASVAKKFGISRVELAHANGLGTGAGLRTGQKLKVPSPAPKGTPNKAI